MKTIFKVGMEVWDKTISPNKGKVIEVLEDMKFDFPIKVEFENNTKVLYTNKGCFVKNKGAVPTLSTTDYSVEMQVFEQKTPVPTYEDAMKWLESTEGTNVMSDSVFLTEGNYYTNLNNCAEALKKLILLRDYYNEGWQPDWNNNYFKFCIEFEAEEICNRNHFYNSRVMCFKTEEIRDKFLEEQRELLEIAKPLL